MKPPSGQRQLLLPVGHAGLPECEENGEDAVAGQEQDMDYRSAGPHLVALAVRQSNRVLRSERRDVEDVLGDGGEDDRVQTSIVPFVV